MSDAIRACGDTDLADGEMLEAEGDPTIVVCRIDGEWFAFENNCSHEDFPLIEGDLHGDEIECPMHGARFCVRSGDVREIPATCAIKIYPVHVDNGEVMVEPVAVNQEN